MISEGQIVLFRFPQTDLQAGKLRPALVVRKLPGRHEDWLIAMPEMRKGEERGGGPRRDIKDIEKRKRGRKEHDHGHLGRDKR
jgi:hypothetical protein